MQGYIKAYRKVLDSQLYKHLTSKQRDVMWVCLLRASHCEKEWEWEGNIFKCSPGQFITSVMSIKKNCASDVSIKNIRTALTKLEKWQFLTIKTAKTGTLITIVNWDEYQIEEKKGQSKRQSNGKQVATIKNEENEKNILFSVFWDKYHLITCKPKKDKTPSIKYWKKLKDNERELAIKNIQLYYNDLSDKKYCKKARTYLSDKSFNDEFTHIIKNPYPLVNGSKNVASIAAIEI